MKAHKKDTIWLSCYIYYNEFPDTFLTQKILPLTKQILKEKNIEQYFFIRYFDKRGIHIRLRFKGKKEMLEYRIQPFLKKHYQNIRFVTYRPEITRYGGREGIMLAEKLFGASSTAVLYYLEQAKNNSYENSLGFAIQLNISMAYSLGMDTTQTASFFKHVASHGDETIYAQKLKQQRTNIVPDISHLWKGLDRKILFKEQFFNAWIKEVTLIGNEIQNANKENKLQYIASKKTNRQNSLWYLYESYIHMNNNRLGIYNLDEPYIAYIISRALSHEE